MDIVIRDKYKLEDKIGEGTFGVVFKGKNVKTDEYVAIKMEKKDILYKTLKHETNIINYLFQKKCSYIPKIYWYGLYDKYTCLVMTYFSHSLQDFYERKGTIENNKMNILISQCIEILENIHKCFIVHLDIKPQNFMIKEGEVYLIDFGFAKVFIDENEKHITTGSQTFIGSPKYVSYFSHCGEPNSIRDDLISLGYMYLFLCEGKLLWEDHNYTDNGEHDTVEYEINHIFHPKNKWRMEYKKWDSIKTIPQVLINDKIKDYLEYCYSLSYSQAPNYNYIKSIFLKE